MTSVIHIAGNDVQVGNYLRQRCAWCGAVLIDFDLERVAVPIGQDPRPATWPPGALVEINGNFSTVTEHTDGAVLPAAACAQVDPAVTA